MTNVQIYAFYEGYFKMYKLHISLRGNKVTDRLIREYLNVEATALRGVNESRIVEALNRLLLIPDLYKQVKSDLNTEYTSKQTTALLDRAEKNDFTLSPDEIICLNRGLLDSIYPFPDNPVTLAFINLLAEQGYTAWVNISFKNHVSIQTSRAKLRQLLRNLNKGELSFYDNVMFYSAFYEKGDKNNRTHIHLFTKGIPDNMLEAFQKECSDKLGRTIIEERHAGAIPYAAKKIHSPKLLELDLKKILHAR